MTITPEMLETLGRAAAANPEAIATIGKVGLPEGIDFEQLPKALVLVAATGLDEVCNALCDFGAFVAKNAPSVPADVHRAAESGYLRGMGAFVMLCAYLAVQTERRQKARTASGN